MSDARRHPRVLGLAALAVLAAALLACAPAVSTPPAAQPAVAPSPAIAGPAAATDAPPAAPTTAPPAPIKINAAYAVRSATMMPFWIAHEQGYFAQQGLEVEAAFLPSATSAQALVANSAQFAVLGGQVFDVNLEAGSPVVRYVAGVLTKLVFRLVARPEIATVPDLRGKVAGATGRASVTAYAVRKVLEQHGLQADTDVAMAYPGTTDAVLAALLAGHVQAAALSTPYDVQATSQGLHVLVDVERLNVPYFMSGVAVRTDYEAANRDVIERFLRAHLQGVAAVHHEPETAIAVLGKYLQSNDRELMRAAYESFRPAYSRDQLVPEEAVVATLHDLEHPAARTADPRSFYDNSYLERIKASGYVDRLYAGR